MAHNIPVVPKIPYSFMVLRIHNFLIFLTVFLLSCDRFPRDQEGSLKEIHGKGEIMAGLTENPPFVYWNNGEPQGIEPEMIKAFAASIGVDVKWIRGSSEDNFRLLQNGRLQIAAGGFDKNSPWKKDVYFTRPHDTIYYKWGAPVAADLPKKLKNQEVFIKKGSIAAAFLKPSVKVHFKDSMEGNEPLVVAPQSDLVNYGYSVSDKTLKTVYIAFAVKKGENALLEDFEKFDRHYERKNKN